MVGAGAGAGCDGCEGVFRGLEERLELSHSLPSF